MESTNRCPYCAEEVLAAAIKCKHCRSALDVSTTAPGQPVATADCGWIILVIPLTAVVLMWFWVAQMAFIQGPESSLPMVLVSTPDVNRSLSGGLKLHT